MLGVRMLDGYEIRPFLCSINSACKIADLTTAGAGDEGQDPPVETARAARGARTFFSWGAVSICSRILSVAWGFDGVGFGVRFKAPSPPGSCRLVHDASRWGHALFMDSWAEERSIWGERKGLIHIHPTF